MIMRKILALALSLIMVLSLCSTAFAYHLTDEITELEANNSDLSMEIATQGYTLLENNGVLPLQNTDKKIALFGGAIAYTVKGGTGSGTVNNRLNKYGVNGDNISDAFEDAGWTVTNKTYVDDVRNPLTTVYDRDENGNYMRDENGRYVTHQERRAATSIRMDRAITEAELDEAKAADTVIYAIARNAGEGSDRQPNSGNGAYNLTAIELANLDMLTASFENVIVVLNTCVMDTSWVAAYDNIDAVVYMNNGGQRGSEALIKVLTGEVTPSGKLTDTWPLSYADYPSTAGFSNNDGNTNTEWYTDGIYVGYRYFDTFGVEVSYPFGYGLSYTDFDITVQSIEADANKVTVVAAVTNIGDTYSGKEVVEVYFSAPDGELEKPYQELAAYGKTDELAPGESQILTLTYDTTDMSSYSEERAAYIMEAGDYIIRVGNSSRNTVAAAKIVLDATAVTEQLSNQLALETNANLEEISKAGATPIANNDEAELANAPVIELKAADLPYENNASPYDDETITTYLFAEDAENYTSPESTTLKNLERAGILENSHQSGTDRYGNPTYTGYMTTTYSEKIEIVPDLPEGITKETAKLTDVIDGKITMDQFIACLTIDEMAELCVGEGRAKPGDPEYGYGLANQKSAVIGGAAETSRTYKDTRHIPGMAAVDGPAGLRISQSYVWDGETRYQFCTAFPVGTTIAMTWDADVVTAFGIAIGEEMKEYGVTSWLAPGMNIHRNPLCGRNFEYYSEDPLLSGLTATYVTVGVQASPGLGVTIKHFFGNSQEANRKNVNNVTSERANREIYLKGFEICVKLAQPMFIMNSYNEVNGWSTPDSWDLNTDILRGEWGYKGLVMSDWSSTSATEFIAMHAGDSLIMPGGDPTTITKGLTIAEPTFNEDGSILDAGNFVVAAGGETSYKTPTNAASEAELADSIKEAIANSEAKYEKIGSDATVTWFGNIDYFNKIYLGDLQKGARLFLNVVMQSQDMEKLYAEKMDGEYEVAPFSEGNDAPAALDWTQATKSDVKNMGIVAEKVTVDLAETQEAAVKVEYKGEDELTTVRLIIDSALPIASIESANDFEYNEADGRIIVYKADGSAIDNELFAINYAFDGIAADGEYPVALSLIEVTDIDGEPADAITIDGAVIIDNTYAKGDINQDGEVTNADLIMIARYLVGLVEFNDKQLEAADYNEDGNVTNADLVLIARAIVAA